MNIFTLFFHFIYFFLLCKVFWFSSLFGNPFSISTSFPPDIQSASSVFSKYVEVYGLRILATTKVPDLKVLHTAHVLAEYLDNNEDGMIDQPEVLNALLGSSNSTISTMVLFASETEEESFASSLGPLQATITRSQNLYADEIFENGSLGANRDATLEEVLHLVTDKGWDEAFPEIWGEKPGSSVANAMDLARGGFFESIPSAYPQNAWYTYYDQTSDYPTQVTEYVYWATTTYMGGQNWPGREHSDFTSEWKPVTQSDLNSTDPVIVSLLTSPDYNFPSTQLPDGNYSVPSVRVQAVATGSNGWKKSSWLGHFYEHKSNWIYHETLGWLYPSESDLGSTWFYHETLGWFWTRPADYPWLYFHTLQGWRYYLHSSGFYDPGGKVWVIMENFQNNSNSSTASNSVSFQIERVELSPSLISYYEANASFTSGWSKVAEESGISSSTPLNYLQGDSPFERRARIIVSNYRSQVAAGGPLILTINGKTTSNQISIEKDSGNNQLVVTGNGVPNYKPSVMGIEVTNGWNTDLNGGFQNLKLSENNLGAGGGNNPNQIVSASETFRIPLSPVNNSTATETSLGTVGVALNGIPVYNPFEDSEETAAYGRIFSNCCGHPQRNGVYHYHKYPTCLRLISDNWKSEKEKCDEIDALLVAKGHSPLIGFASDGWPIYGPVGWKNENSQTGVLLKSSYTGVNDSAGNPTYVAGSGDLDECNGLTSPTPEFPEGIYHYVMSIEADSDGTVFRYLNPHFGYDVRRTLKKNNLMPSSWTEDATYLEALKAGFSVNNIIIPGTDSFNTFVEFISSMQSTLASNSLSNVGAEFETMKIDYPYTIRKYRGNPSTSTNATQQGTMPSTNNSQANGITSVSPPSAAKGSAVTLTIVLNPNANPPLPPANVNPGSVKIGPISLSNVNRISETTITGTLNIPSESGTGIQNLNVQFSTPNGMIQFDGNEMFVIH